MSSNFVQSVKGRNVDRRRAPATGRHIAAANDLMIAHVCCDSTLASAFGGTRRDETELPVARYSFFAALRSIMPAAISTTATTSQRITTTFMSFTINAAINTAGMPPIASAIAGRS